MFISVSNNIAISLLKWLIHRTVFLLFFLKIGIENLEPKGASLEDKFKMNAFQGHPEFEDGKQFLGLRSSRVNHNCSLNAGMSCD